MIISVNGKDCAVEADKNGALRFKRNPIVKFLYELTKDNQGIDLNLIRSLDIFTEDDLLEFYRLLGYSVDGYRDVFPDAEIVERRDQETKEADNE